ncbi:MAG: AAA family ATPase [Gaiellaceae bacterium]
MTGLDIQAVPFGEPETPEEIDVDELHELLAPTHVDIEFAPDIPARLSLRQLDSYRIRRVEWLDKPHLQRGAFHLLAGRKGVCKGTWICRTAARVTTGELYGEPKRVLVITSEDSIELDFLPRLIAAGGDPSKVAIVNGPFQLPGDIDWLRAQAQKLGNVGLIVIDPLGNHAGGKDTNAEGDTRAAIQDLNPLADELDCMVFGVRHLSKDASRGALSSVLGSTAWVDVPRAVILMAADDEDDMLFHAQVVAGNRGPKSATGRAYRLELHDVEPARDITCLTAEGESTKDVEQLLNGRSADAAPESRSAQARELILDILENEGEQESDAFDARISAETGISAKTVRNIRGTIKNDGLIRATPAKDELGTVTHWTVSRTLAPRTDA